MAALCFTFTNAVNSTMHCFHFCMPYQLYFKEIYTGTNIYTYHFWCSLIFCVDPYFHLVSSSVCLREILQQHFCNGTLLIINSFSSSFHLHCLKDIFTEYRILCFQPFFPPFITLKMLLFCFLLVCF